MAKDGISTLADSRGFFVSIENIVARWALVVSIVHQHGNVFFRKTPYILDVVLHVEAVIVASTQLTILSRVVDTNENCPPRSLAIGWYNIKLLAHVQWMGGGQLWDLRVFSRAQDMSHSLEDLNKRQIRLTIILGVENFLVQADT